MPRGRSLPLLRTIGPVHSVVHVVRKQQLQAADLSFMHGYTHRQSHRQRIASVSCHAAMVAAPIAQDHWRGPGGCACSAGVVAAGLWHRARPRGAKPKREQNRSFDPYRSKSFIHQNSWRRSFLKGLRSSCQRWTDEGNGYSARAAMLLPSF